MLLVRLHFAEYDIEQHIATYGRLQKGKYVILQSPGSWIVKRVKVRHYSLTIKCTTNRIVFTMKRAIRTRPFVIKSVNTWSTIVGV